MIKKQDQRPTQKLRQGGIIGARGNPPVQRDAGGSTDEQAHPGWLRELADGKKARIADGRARSWTRRSHG